MNTGLDLDDVCAGNPLAERQLAELRAEVSTPVLVATNRLADALADARAEVARLRAEREELMVALARLASPDAFTAFGLGRWYDDESVARMTYARAALAEKGE